MSATRHSSSASSSGQHRNRKLDERLQQQSSLSDAEPPQSAKQLVRVRSFTTRSGTVVNRGDSFKSRSSRGTSATGSGGTPRLAVRPVSSRADSRRAVADDDGDNNDDDDEDVAPAGYVVNGRRPARRSLPQAGWSTEYVGGGAGPLIVNRAADVHGSEELVSTGGVAMSGVARDSPVRSAGGGSGQLRDNGMRLIAV